MKKNNICSIESCDNKIAARTWCIKHYRRWRRTGDPTNPGKYPIYSTPEESFAARTERRGDCLIWTGAKGKDGYGRIRIDGRLVQAHRFAWEKVNGKIPDGMLIDHANHCSILCCNVEHLRLATPKQNSRNLSGASSNNKSSGVRNVYRDGNRWRVRVMKNRKTYSFGIYSTIEEAAKVAEKARAELFREFSGRG